MIELTSPTPEIAHAVESIHGETLEQRINQLSEIGEGGRIGEGGSRLAFSAKEKDARRLLEAWMEEAGMMTKEYPWGIVGTL